MHIVKFIDANGNVGRVGGLADLTEVRELLDSKDLASTPKITVDTVEFVIESVDGNGEVTDTRTVPDEPAPEDLAEDERVVAEVSSTEFTY